MADEPPDSQNIPEPTADNSGADSSSSGDNPGTAENAAVGDYQDNFLEPREPVELMFCIILAAAYAGLAKYCWSPLIQSGAWLIFFNIEGFFITIGLLALMLGMRPYLSPSNLQISKHGIKYRGPYWPQRKTINWSQVFRMYVSPDLILILYKLPNKPKSIRPLIIHSVYLSDRERIPDSIVKYSPIEPIFLANPDWVTRCVCYILLALIVFWIMFMLMS